MAGTVIERHGHTVDERGRIHYDDRPQSIEHAELIAGRRLDRRRNYAIINGEVCEAAWWTQECSGCDGGGCDECGYTGKRRTGAWVPLTPNAQGEPQPAARKDQR